MLKFSVRVILSLPRPKKSQATVLDPEGTYDCSSPVQTQQSRHFLWMWWHITGKCICINREEYPSPRTFLNFSLCTSYTKWGSLASQILSRHFFTFYKIQLNLYLLRNYREVHTTLCLQCATSEQFSFSFAQVLKLCRYIHSAELGSWTLEPWTTSNTF